MAAAQPSSPAPSSPDLEGYDSALEEVNTPRRRVGNGGGESVSSDDSNRTIRTPPQRVSLIGANQEPVRGRAGTLPAWDARGRFTRRCGSAQSADSAASSGSRRSRQSSGIGREIGSASDLVSSQQSLTWDNCTPPIQQEDDLFFDYENSATSGLVSDTLQEHELEQLIDEPECLTPVDERGESRASTGEHEQTMTGENAAGSPSDDIVAAALLEVEDFSVEVEEDIGPYIGQQLTWERLHEMLNRCKELKKLFRGSDLLLKHARVVAYDDQKQAMVQEAKTTLTAAMRHFDTLLVTLTAERAAAGTAGGGDGRRGDQDVSMSSDGSEVDQELLDHTTQRVISWQAEYRILMNKIEELCADKPVDEEHLNRVDEHLIIISNEAAVRSKDGTNIAAALHKCRAYREERQIQENIATLHTRRPRCDRICLPGTGRWGFGRRRAGGWSTGPT
jgi:hypothetical protein